MARGAAPRRRSVWWARGLWSGAEAAVTVGVVLLLLVVHQVWWTNREAQEGAARQVRALERQWEGVLPSSAGGGLSSGSGSSEPGSSEPGSSREVMSSPAPGGGASSSAGDTPVPRESRSGAQADPPAPRWDQAYAVLAIPRLGLRVPVAEGVSKANVLNKGYAGHYPGTAQPGRAGNFALAGHRNTHGEPFRYINRLKPGDRLTVETREAVYAYAVDRTLPQTLPRDGSVIADIPRSEVKSGYGYREPGYYLTLTTCTPEYSSKYRLVVWGKLKSVTPR
ncbi:class E sortase [Streptomyces sp. E11-3]|uniref:class E sortase n=1 Tax=Streptomyces sp. E11-3 TaxID=3110112 RepID=UPI00398155EF